jgi:hypothetical protein
VLIPTQYRGIVLFLNVAFSLFGLGFHCIASRTLEGSAAIILNLVATVLPALIILYVAFPKNRSTVLHAFFLFFSVYFLFSSFARLNAEIFNPESEIYQNDSDATTIFELSVDWNAISREEARLITDTVGSLRVFHLFYRLISILNLTPTPSIGITLNTVLVAVGSAVGVIGSIRLFGKWLKPVRLVTLWYATSGLAFLYSGLHLRDSFLYLLNALLFLLLVNTECKRIDGRFLINLLLSGCLGGAMTMFRDESGFIYYGFMLTLSLETIVHLEKRWRYPVLVVCSILAFVAARLLIFQYSDLIEATNLNYRENQGSIDGLATKYIVSAPNWLRPIIGIPYMILAHVPFFSGFLLHEWYYWFVSIQAVQAIVVFPSFAYFVFKWAVRNKFEGFDPLRRMFIFYIIMGSIISMSTLSYRHYGQFLPYLYVIAARGYIESSTGFRWFSSVFIVVPVSVLWLILKL